MADDMRLMLGLEVDAEQFSKDWENKYRKKIEAEIQKKPVSLKIETTGVKEALAAVKELQKDLQLVKPSTVASVNAQQIRAQASAEATLAKARVKNANDTAIAEAKVAKIKAQTAAVERRATRATLSHNQALLAQKGILNGMPQFLNAYISVLGGVRFVQNIKDITAEFDKQRRALGAIIQDADMANRLFQQTLNLAVSSPFTAKDLIGYVKQLSAYKIESDKLFDTTKMLADVSAGLSVDMGRIILAYGQIRAKGRLAGSELRQLTEAGIPAVEMLADKFTELKGRVVSTSEVFDMISKKQVYFEDVEQMFKDMTSEGGMFYQMQSKLADTLHGVWQKLGDAMQIAMSEIGNENMGVLRSAAEVMLVVAKNLSSIVDYAANGALAWGSYRIATMLASKSLLQMTIAQKRVLVSTTGLSRVASMATLSFKGLGVAIKQTWATMLRHPMGWVAAAVGLLAERVFKLIDSHREQKKAIAEINELYNAQRATVNQLVREYNKLESASDAYKEKFKLLSELSKMSKKLHKNLSIDLSIVTPDNIDEVFNNLKSQYDEAILYARHWGSAMQEASGDIGKSVKNAGEAWDDLTKKLGASNVKFAEISETLLGVYPELNKIEQGFVDDFLIIRKAGESEEDSIKRRIGDLLQLRAVYSENSIGQQKDIFNVRKANRERFAENKDYVLAITDLYEDLVKADKKVAESVRNVVNEFKNANLGLDFNNLSDAQKRNIAIAIKTKFDEQDGWSELESRMATRKASTIFQIPLEFFYPEPEKDAHLKKWIKDFNNALGQGALNEEATYPKAVSDAIKTYKDAKSSVELYNKAQAKGITVDKQKQEDATELTKKIYALAQKYGFLGQLLEKVNGKPKDNRQQKLQAEIDTVKEAYKQYEKLRKLIGDTSAYNKVNEAFSELFEDFSFTKGIVPTDVSQLSEYLKTALNTAIKQGIGDKKFRFNLGSLISDTDIEGLEKDLRDKLQKMKEDVSRSKEAQTFFEGLLSQGKNLSSAFAMTLSIYGVDPQSIRSQLEQNLKTALAETFDEDINLDAGLGSVEKKIREAEGRIGETKTKMLLDLVKDLRDYDAETIRSLQKNLSKFSEYELKRTEIMRKGAKERREIDSSPMSEADKRALRETSVNKEREQLDKAQWDEFKNSDLYVEMFDSLDSTATVVLDRMSEKLRDMQSRLKGLDAQQLKEIQSRLAEIDKVRIERNPFRGWGDAWREYRDILSEIRDAEDEWAQSHPEEKKRKNIKQIYAEQLKQFDISQQVTDEHRQELIALEEEHASLLNNASATQEQKDAQLELLRVAEDVYETSRKTTNEAKAQVEETGKLLQKKKWADQNMKERAHTVGLISGQIQSIAGDIQHVLELFGEDAETSETMATVNDVSTFLGGLGDVVEGIMSLNPAKIIHGFVGVGEGLYGLFSGLNRRVARMNKIIKQQADLIDSLSFSYKRLEKATSQSLGSDYIKAIRKEQENLKAQADAYQKMYYAESNKGKKRDPQKMKSYLQSYEETLYKIEDMQDELVAYMAGQDRESAAKQFAQQWYEAYKSFKSTAQAIKDSFADLMDNLIINALMSKAVQTYLKPVYDTIEKAMADNEITAQEIADIVNLAGTQSQGMNDALTQIMEGLEKVGIDVHRGESNLTGISASAAGITEDTALTLGAIGNNLVYYVVGIHDLLQSHYSEDNTGGMSLISIQQDALAEIRAIHMDTTRIALATERLTDQIASVTAPLGTRAGAKAINVNV